MTRELTLPNQIGNTGKVLTTDGFNTYWGNSGGSATITSGVTPLVGGTQNTLMYTDSSGNITSFTDSFVENFQTQLSIGTGNSNDLGYSFLAYGFGNYNTAATSPNIFGRDNYIDSASRGTIVGTLSSITGTSSDFVTILGNSSSSNELVNGFLIGNNNQFNTRGLSSVIIGLDSTINDADNSFIVGKSSNIGDATGIVTNTFLVGNDNTAASGSNNFVAGHNNYVTGAPDYCGSYGSNIQIGSGNENVFSYGLNLSSSNTSNTVIMGVNLTADNKVNEIHIGTNNSTKTVFSENGTIITGGTDGYGYLRAPIYGGNSINPNPENGGFKYNNDAGRNQFGEALGWYFYDKTMLQSVLLSTATQSGTNVNTQVFTTPLPDWTNLRFGDYYKLELLGTISMPTTTTVTPVVRITNPLLGFWELKDAGISTAYTSSSAITNAQFGLEITFTLRDVQSGGVSVVIAQGRWWLLEQGATSPHQKAFIMTTTKSVTLDTGTSGLTCTVDFYNQFSTSTGTSLNITNSVLTNKYGTLIT